MSAKLTTLTKMIEDYDFECEAGPLSLCVDWLDLKVRIAHLEDALDASIEWMSILRGSCGDVSMSMFDERDPSEIEAIVYLKIAKATTLSPAQGEVSHD